MGYKIDLRSWKVFGTLQPSFIHEIRMAMVVGCAEAGIVVTRNNHVFSIGSGPCLGVKDTIHTTVPLELAELSGEKVKGIYSGQDFVVMLTEDGKLFVWGDNTNGQLGLGRDESPCTPTRLYLPNDECVAEVACGQSHTLALTAVGKVYLWGSLCPVYMENDRQIHQGIRWKPTDAFGHGPGRFLVIACGRHSALASTSGGQIWGLGMGFAITHLVTLDAAIKKIVCNYDEEVLTLDCTGQLRAWKCNTGISKLSSQPLGEDMGKVLDIAATWHSSLKVYRAESGVYFWGEWFGKRWASPTRGSFASMDTLFAVEYDTMCRPFVVTHERAAVVGGFSEEFNKQDGADVAIHLPDNRVIYAHQVVLTSRSRYFRGLCCNELVQPKPPATLAQIAVDRDYDCCYSLLHYIYKGRLDDSILEDEPKLMKRILLLLETSKDCDQMDLFTECKKILMSELTTENALEVFQVANKLQIGDLEKCTLAPPYLSAILQSGPPRKLVKLIGKRLSKLAAEDKNIAPNLGSSPPTTPQSGSTSKASTIESSVPRCSSATPTPVSKLGTRFSGPTRNSKSSAPTNSPPTLEPTPVPRRSSSTTSTCASGTTSTATNGANNMVAATGTCQPVRPIVVRLVPAPTQADASDTDSPPCSGVPPKRPKQEKNLDFS